MNEIPTGTNLYDNFNQPSTAQRCRSETEKNILEDLFSSVLSKFKKYHPSGNLEFNYVDIFQSLKLRNLMGEILRIALISYISLQTLWAVRVEENAIFSSDQLPQEKPGPYFVIFHNSQH